MRSNRTLSVLILVLAFSVAVKLSTVGADGLLRSEQSSPAATPTPSQPSRLHVLYTGLWRTDGNFVSTISIKNVLVVAPIQVNPVLFMADGTAYPLPAVTLPIAGVTTVNINDALAVPPQTIASHISPFGSATLIYSFPSPGHVIASVAAIDAPRSLSFVYPVVEPMPMPADNKEKVLEGLWWKHDRAVRGSVSLTNTSDQEKMVTLNGGKPGGDSDAKHLDLAPHATQLLDLEQISRDASDPDNRAGGIRIEYQGPREAILVTGSLANESEGYSANMPFVSHDVVAQDAASSSPSEIDIASVGLMVGKPHPMMMPGFPANTRFTPYMALRNTTAESVDVALQLNYMPGMDGSVPVTRNLRTQRLRPFEARHVKLEEMLDGARLKSFDGMINLSISFTGHPGDLVVASGSVDQTGTYVFEVSPQGMGSSIGKITGYWSVANGNDAMFSLWNPTEAGQDIIATIFYGDGSGTYNLPVRLAPQASTMIDIGMLISNKTSDAEGKVIPPNIRDGSVSFASAGTDSSQPDGKKRMTVVIAGGNFNVADATCGQTCAYCDGYSNFRLNPTILFCLVGCTATFIAQATDSYGTTQTLTPNSWSSDNTGVMTVNNSGGAHAVGSGKTFVNAFFNSIITWQGTMCVSDNMTPNCNPMAEVAGAQVTVAPAISQNKMLWYFGQGVATPSGFTVGATSATLTANGAGNGTYVWTITNGTSKAKLENNSSTITKTNVNTVGINSASFSIAANDVSVQLQFTPSGGSQVTTPWALSIDSPYKLVPNGSTTSRGAANCSGGSNPPSGSNGFVSNVPYKIVSFFNVTVANAPINEAFGTVINVVPNNWGSVPPGSVTPPAGVFVDTLCTAGTFNPQPTPPQSPLSGTIIQKFPQSWYVGSGTSGTGIQVQSDTSTYYIDHGAHLSVVSPVR